MYINISKNETINLLKSFYELTHIRIVFFDTEFNELFGYPESNSEFCTKMRQNPEFERRCNESAKDMCIECKKEKNLIIKKCHAGLTEVVAPVIKDGIVMGYIMFGQIRSEKNKEKFSTDVADLCEKYCSDRKFVESLAYTVHYKTHSQTEAAAEIINVFVSYLHMKEIVALRDDSASVMIMNYINNNLENKLDINTICRALYLSRTTLYELSKTFAPDGISAYIKIRRIEKAKKLLSLPGASAQQVAKEVGFSDVNYFRRTFKEVTGIPVGKFKNKLM